MRARVLLVLSVLVLLLLPYASFLAQDGPLQIVASQGILADVVRNVAGEGADVLSLIPVGGDPHSFIPSPADLITVADADLVFLVGAGYEEGLLETLENAGETVDLVVASACVEILPYGVSEHADDEHMDDHADEHTDDGHADEHDDDDHADEHDDDEHADEHDDDGHADEHADDEHADEHDDDEHADEHDDDGHADDDDHADEHDDDDHSMDASAHCDEHDAEVAALIGEEEDHDHLETLGRAGEISCGAGHGHEGEHQHGEGSCDPHIWMDPHNVIYWTLMIRDALTELDPGHAADYVANAAAYADELVALEADFILPTLEALPQENRVLVTGHESLGYFAVIFDFELVTTIVPGSATLVEPSARDLAALIDRVRAAGVTAIFGDAYSPDRVMETIASETDVAIVPLYSDTLSAADGPAATYLDYMRYNVSTIVDALKP